MLRSRSLASLSLFVALALPTRVAAQAQTDGVHAETRVDQVRAEYGVTGAGTLVAIVDRGIDYEHPDFRNADGTTRIVAIYDLTDNRGANAPDNPSGVGTVYTRAEIDAALVSGVRLTTRDAVGHGTATAGIAAGNGRASSGLYTGVAPGAELVVVKFTTEGAAAHDGEPAEAAFYTPDLLPAALDFVLARAAELGRPVVLLGNFGSSGGPMDGSSRLGRTLATRFGPGFPGRVFITGTSDDGGVANHAGGTVAQGQVAAVQVRKGYAGNLRFSLWYPGADRFTVEVVAPSGTVYGPYAPPANTARASAAPTGGGFSYYHNGADVDFFGATNGKREVMIDFSGPTTGVYTVRLTGTTVTGGQFDASLNPSNIYSRPNNRFETFVDPGHTVWDLAAAPQNLSLNSYVLNPTWTDVDGVTRTYPGNTVGTGALWPGSGIGPTYDGRLGVSVSAPGQANFTPYAPRSVFAASRSSLIVDGPAPYGVLGFVSGAAPVVTGIVALMLQADPTLDAAEVRSILEQTARTDAFTGAVPNPSWGYGKVDAYAAVSRVRQGTPTESGASASGLALTASPNPVRDSMTLTLVLPEAGPVTIGVYDVLGRQAAVLHDGLLTAGSHTHRLDMAALPPGVYIIRAAGAGTMVSQRVTVVR